MGRVLVTGGARGLGRAIGTALEAAGHTVILCDRDADAIRAVGGGEVCDVSDPGSVAALFERLGPLDVLVNNAGTSVVKPALDLTPDEWNRVIGVNLTGAFLCAQAAARGMRAAGRGGCIVNVTSVSGQRGSVGRAAYGASKGGLETLTRVLAVELAPLSIRVNAVAPGPVDTELARATHSQATRAAYAAAIPMARYGREAEVAAAVVFLASDAAAYVTGHVLNVDGGFAAAGIAFDPAAD
ncbi:MAG: SDR family NAD(P)-dependent oxidoreductase [Pseudomonadota bacterium]